MWTAGENKTFIKLRARIIGVLCVVLVSIGHVTERVVMPTVLNLLMLLEYGRRANYTSLHFVNGPAMLKEDPMVK